ncbi:Pimeloyl-ACP methyl ester carboxylesterase [Cognatiyoonia sediminum]|uniref:Pimeloyl-ACP methyl ester carboxylesterase n=1 Tax=Cognatiyoonia sediminum TaxID=1508389 RepID=A0A1M5MBV5_9RHOB|nr:alpha/beta hydrolase [Cognatiyoonia sediminum]SHG74758.1 Pimeloyl-ACP methyl ester carboxylesterase [Cognatiyoonia sediminum]
MMWTTQPRSEIAGYPAIVKGKGQPVLFLHGVGLRAEAWAAQLDGLANHAQVFAPDMLGHGENKRSRSSQTMSDYLDVTSAILGSLPFPAIVVGHSMGSMLALALAKQHPDLVETVVALNAIFDRSNAAAKAVQSRADELDGVTQVDPTVTLERWFEDKESPERDACRSWLETVDPSAYKSAYTAFAYSQIPNRELLTNVACPSIFMTGVQEPNSTPAMSTTMAEIVPRGRAIIVEGAAHMLPMTHPDQVNSVLLEILEGAAQ